VARPDDVGLDHHEIPLDQVREHQWETPAQFHRFLSTFEKKNPAYIGDRLVRHLD